jgi:hypothetical protein
MNSYWVVNQRQFATQKLVMFVYLEWKTKTTYSGFPALKNAVLVLVGMLVEYE